MRNSRLYVGVLTFVLATAATTVYAHKCMTCPSFKNTKSIASKNLASLEGCWRGSSREGVASEVSYEMGSDGTALLETQWVDRYTPVYTMYYMDGTGITAHHFCSMGNQIRMRGTESGGGSLLSFKYMDATNMERTTQPHMTGTSITFRDKDHMEVKWASSCDDGGGEGQEMVTYFSYERVTDGCNVGKAKSWSER